MPQHVRLGSGTYITDTDTHTGGGEAGRADAKYKQERSDTMESSIESCETMAAKEGTSARKLDSSLTVCGLISTS